MHGYFLPCPFPCPCDGLAYSDQVTLKLFEPWLSVSEVGLAWEVPSIMVMGSTVDHEGEALSKAAPLACTPLNCTCPKSASGSTPLIDEGASAIHSADWRRAVEPLAPLAGLWNQCVGLRAHFCFVGYEEPLR